MKKIIERKINLKDKEITRLYNKAYGDPAEGERVSKLAEEMFAACAFRNEEGNQRSRS